MDLSPDVPKGWRREERSRQRDQHRYRFQGICILSSMLTLTDPRGWVHSVPATTEELSGLSVKGLISLPEEPGLYSKWKQKSVQVGASELCGGVGTAQPDVHGGKWSVTAPEGKACPKAVGNHPCQRWGNLEQWSGAALWHRADPEVSSFMRFAKIPRTDAPPHVLHQGTPST